MDMNKYYGQLVGCKIKDFTFEKDEWGGSDFPVFTLTNGSEEVRFVISQDEEVNDHWLTYKEASDLADKCVRDGHSPIIGNRD